MATTIVQLFNPNQVNNAAVETLYTVPSTPTTTVLRNARVRFTNTTGGAVTISAHAVPSGGTAADDNAFLKTYSIAANDYIDIDVPEMAAGGILQAQAGAATSITAFSLGGVLYS